jgi:hypothetical protein
MFTLKPERNILFCETKQIASGRRFGDIRDAGRPMELDARCWAIAAALFFW